MMEWMDAGLAELESQRVKLDQYNLFPVPDGDTGRNMTATVRAAVNAMHQSRDESLGAILARMADGALMGARGNSGVILSQIFAGLAEVGRSKSFFEAADLRYALQNAARRARRHVVNPVEGTILTVADAVAETAVADGGDLCAWLDAALACGEAALKRTAEQLPTLTGTGLVDAGALGYVLILRGWNKAARGVSMPLPEKQEPWVLSDVGERRFHGDTVAYYYDVEALLYRLRHAEPEDILAERLSEVGDSIVIAPGLNTVKVHVHTDQPVALMKILADVGDIRQMEWLDMRAQIEERRQDNRLSVVVDPDLHPVFEGMCRVLDPDLAKDEPDLLWVRPTRPLTHAIAVPTVGLAGQAALEYVGEDRWDVNRERLSRHLAAMKSWLVGRSDQGYMMSGRLYPSAEALLAALLGEMDTIGIVTVYLSREARREEAAFWQDALAAALVQVPADEPWMEIVWQP